MGERGFPLPFFSKGGKKMGHVDYDVAGVLRMPAEGNENPEAIRERLVNLGKKNVQSPALPSTPEDCIGNADYLSHFGHSNEETVPDEIVDGLTEELAAEGALPGDDLSDILGG